MIRASATAVTNVAARSYARRCFFSTISLTRPLAMFQATVRNRSRNSEFREPIGPTMQSHRLEQEPRDFGIESIGPWLAPAKEVNPGIEKGLPIWQAGAACPDHLGKPHWFTAADILEILDGLQESGGSLAEIGRLVEGSEVPRFGLAQVRLPHGLGSLAIVEPIRVVLTLLVSGDGVQQLVIRLPCQGQAACTKGGICTLEERIDQGNSGGHGTYDFSKPLQTLAPCHGLHLSDHSFLAGAASSGCCWNRGPSRNAPASHGVTTHGQRLPNPAGLPLPCGRFQLFLCVDVDEAEQGGVHWA